MSHFTKTRNLSGLRLTLFIKNYSDSGQIFMNLNKFKSKNLCG